MARSVAFLRAINVGGHTVKMGRLRDIFSDLGLSNVETFIASGNVVFDTPRRARAGLESLIATGLHEELGYDVATFVRGIPEIATVSTHWPFSIAPPRDGDGRGLYVGFLATLPDASAIARLMELQSDTNGFAVVGTEVYWTVVGNFSDSGIAYNAIEKRLGRAATFRNITTVRKIAAKYS